MTPTDGEDIVLTIANRGKGNAEQLLGSFKGTRITDCYPAYKNLPGDHQTCWVHLLRAARDLSEAHILSQETQDHCTLFYEQITSLYDDLTHALTLKNTARKRRLPAFRSRVDTLCTEHPLDPKKLHQLKQRLHTYQHTLFTCLTKEGVPPHNNKAEQKLRHLVLKRKNCFGTRTPKGSHIFSINASVALSQWWSDRTNWFPAMHQLLWGGV